MVDGNNKNTFVLGFQLNTSIQRRLFEVPDPWSFGPTTQQGTADIANLNHKPYR